MGHLTLHRTLCTVVTFSEGMAGVTSSSCIKLVNAIIISPAVPTTGSAERVGTHQRGAVVCVCACGVCACVQVCACVCPWWTDGGLIISAASLWLLQHAISDARGSGDHAAVCIEVIDDRTNPQAVISTTLPRYVSERVSRSPLRLGVRCSYLDRAAAAVALQCGVAAVVDAAVARLLQASHHVVGAGGDVPSRDCESAARSASSAVRCRVK